MNPELGRRIAFTLAALLIYRFGTFIPIPGLDPSSLELFYRAPGGGILELFKSLSGGVHRLSILALDILPYVIAAIMARLASFVSVRLRALEQDERGRSIIERWTIALAVLLVTVQAFGIALALEEIPSLVIEPGWMFRITAALTMAGGTVFLVWLSRQITARGIGNGIALILLAGIVVEVPPAIAATLEVGRQGLLSVDGIVVLLAVVVAAVAFIAFMERAQRLVRIDFAARRVGGRIFEGQPSPLRFKLNGAGVIPLFVAPWLLYLPVRLIDPTASPTRYWWAEQLEHGRPLFMLFTFVVIVVAALIYVALLLDPSARARDLQRHGGGVPGVEPGEKTADYLNGVLSHVTLVGVLYLGVIGLIAEVLIANLYLPFDLRGISLLIMVGAVMDVEAQVRAYAPIRSRG